MPGPERPRRRRLLRFAIRAAAVFAALVVGAYLFRGVLFGRTVAKAITDALGRATGGVYSLEAVEGGWISDAVLVGLRTETPPPSGALREIRFERARVTFSLRDLFGDALRALRDVDVEDLRLVLDTRATGAPKSDTPGASVAEVLAGIPRPLPHLDVRGSVLLRSPEGEWKSARLHVTGGATVLHLDLDATTTPLAGGAGPSRLRGDLAWDEPLVVRWTSAAEFAGATVSAATLKAESDRAWRLDARVAAAGGLIEGLVSEKGFEATGRTLDLAKLPEWARALVGAGASLPRSGVADLHVVGDSASIRGTVDARTLGWNERAVDRLKADVVWSERRLTINSLDASGEAMTASVRDVVLVPDAPSLVARAGEITASTADAGAAALRFGLTEIVSRLPPHPVAVNVRVRSPAGRDIQVQALTVDAGSTRIDVRGSAALSDDPKDWRGATLGLDVTGSVSLDDVRRAAPAGWFPPQTTGTIGVAAHVAGRAERPRVTGKIEGSDLRLGEQRVDRLAATAVMEGELLSVTGIEMASSFADVRAKGSLDLEKGVVHDAQAEFTASDLAALSRAFPALPALQGELHGSASVSGTPPEGLRGQIAVRGARLAVRDWNVGTLDAAGRLDRSRVTVDRLSAEGPLGSVTAAGALDVTSGALDVSAFRANVSDLLEVTRRFPGAPSISGAVRVEGSLRRAAGAPWEDVEGDLRIAGQGLSAAGIHVNELATDAKARGGHVELSRMQARGDFGEVALDGAVDFGQESSHASLRRLAWRRGAQVASIARPVELTWSKDALETSEVDAAVGTTGRIHGAAHIDATNVVAKFEATNVDLSVFSARAVGIANARLEVEGPSANPNGHLAIEAPSLRLDGDAVAVSVDLTQDARGIRLDRLALDAGALLRVDGEGYLPLRIGSSGFVRPDAAPPARLALRIVSAQPDRWRELVTDEPVTADGIEATVRGEGRDLVADLRLKDLRWAGVGTKPVRLAGDTVMHVEVHATGTTAQLSTPRGGPMTIDGRFRTPAAPDWSDPGHLRDALRGAPLEGTLSLDVADLSAAVQWVPGIRRLAGHARGELTVRGTVEAPEWMGRVDAQDVAVLVPGDVAPIDRGTAVLRFERRRLVIEQLTGRLGHAPVTVTGHLDFADGGPARVDLHVVGENALIVRSHDLRLRADVDVAVAGALDAPSIKGSVHVTRALYTRPMDILGRGAASPDQSFQLFSLREEPFSRAQFDVDVTADRTVRVENDLLDAEISLAIHLAGTGEVPEPTGTVTFHGAKVSLPFTNLEVERGQLEFAPGNPFTPRIRAVARTTIKGYDLNVMLSGNVPDVEVKVASSPPLSQASARLLLATGATPSELETEGIAGTALSRAGTLLGGAALSFIRGGPGGHGDSLADRVKVEIGREESEQGVKTVTAEFRLAERWYLVAERDRFEDYNMGIVWRVRFQ